MITDRYGSSLGSTDHGMDPHAHWDAVTIPELPSDKVCYGSDTCTQTFRSYYDALYSHLEKCGTAERVEDAAWRIARKIKNQIDENYDSDHPNYDSSLEIAYPTAYKYLKKGAELRRVVNNIRDEILRVRTQAEGCGRSYYNCISSSKELHTNRRCLANSLQDDGADAGDDSSTSTIVCNIQGCTMTGAYDPSDTSSAALHAYCDRCYLYKCNGSDHSAANCGISEHHVCDNNSHVAASCGHSGHYVCDSLTHVEEQCSNTSNGVRCTYQFWRCLHPSVPSYGPSHTCVYAVSCGRSACTQTVSSSTQHSATCASGHSYWTCNPSDVSLHITRTCRLSTCGKSWERCSTVGGTPLCDDPWRRSNGLPCWKK